MEPPDFFNEFSPLLKGIAEKRTKKNAAESERADALLEVLTCEHEQLYYRHWLGMLVRDRELRDQKPLRELDPRWLDAAVEAQSLALVCKLARPDHAAAGQFLSEKLTKTKEPHEPHQILQTMVRIGHPGAADAVIAAIIKEAKDTTHTYYGYWYGRLIADLPRSALPKIEALLPTLPDKMVDRLMDSVLALKNKPQ
jgi:hypothetical protein